MVKIIGITIVFILAVVAKTVPVAAITEAESSASFMLREKQDVRAERLKSFFETYDSPLSPYARYFIETSDKYELDWRLVPAISGVESTFGKAIPYGSYNAYGWANGTYRFTSWENSIEIVTKSLRENYLDRGATTVDKIAPIYCPPSTSWGWKVKFFMDKIENHAPSSTLALKLSL